MVSRAPDPAGIRAEEQVIEADIFRCPISRAPLRYLTADEIGSVVAEIQSGRRLHANGLPARVDGLACAVGTHDLRHVYRVDDDVFALLPGLAIVSPADATVGTLDAERRMVQSFYDEFGWAKNEQGVYGDTAAFSSDDAVARRYIARCHGRIGAQLGRGRYLLDAASGAIPGDSYLALSRNYDRRICVDFSIRALREARERLGPGRGVFVLGDLTALPIADGVVDDAISLHTIYHIPKDLQATAIDELVRALKPGGRLVVAYTWAGCRLMKLAKRLVLPFMRPAARASVKPQKPALYYHPHGKAWFRAIARRYPAKLKVGSATDQEFRDRVFTNSKLGRLAAELVYWLEDVLEPITARYGQYPLFVIARPDAAR